MRQDSPDIAAAARAPSKEPRYVIGIIYPTSSPYFTSRAGMTNVPGVPVQGVVEDLGGTSQEIDPSEGRSTIGGFNFTVTDAAGAMTAELRSQLTSNETGPRRREVRVYRGYTSDFLTFVRIGTFMLDSVELDGASYVISCTDIQRQMRDRVFEPKKTRLTATITDTATTLNVQSTTGFERLLHTAAFSDSPSVKVGYVKLKKTGEIISYTGTTSTSFTGCVRERFNTIAQGIEIAGGTDEDRLPEVEEFIYLESPMPHLAYAVLTGELIHANLIANGGGEIGTVGSQATSWALNTGNNLVVATDAARFAARSLKITNAGVTDSASYQDFTVVGGEAYVVEGWIKTSALPTADAGYGAVLNVDIISGVASYTIVEKIGSDPSGSVPDVGVAATGAAVEWQYVYCKFIPNANGSLRLYLHLGYGGGQSGTAWFDGVRVRACGELPDHWHVGVHHSYVRINEFEEMGADLVDPTDVTAGMVGRFTHLNGTDGKAFIERELMVPMGAFLFVDSNGTIGPRRIARILTDAAFVETLNTTNVVSANVIQHDQEAVINQVVIEWNWDGEEFTRSSLTQDLDSIERNGLSEPLQLQLRGVAGARHTSNTIFGITRAFFDRYGEPPLRMEVEVLPSLDFLEVGDVVRVTLPYLRDYQGTSTLNRSFEIQSVQHNWKTGGVSLQLFGTARETPAASPAGAGAAIPDAWYNSEGTALSSVLTIVADAVTTNGALTGSESAQDAAAIYYHLGNLTINSSVTVTFTKNVQLRIRGTLTVNGIMSGVSGGNSPNGDPNTVGFAFIWQTGEVGLRPTLGSARGSAALSYVNGNHYFEFRGLHLFGQMALPAFAPYVVGNGVVGLPKELRGTQGVYGAPVVEQSGSTITTRRLGGSGGAGGAGIVITARGFAFGVNGRVNTSGGNGSVGSTVTLGGHQLYSGGGGGGNPGGALFVADGGSVLAPDLTAAFVAQRGSTTQTGNPIRLYPTIDSAAEPWTGFDPGIGAENLWESAHQFVYARPEVSAALTDDEVTPPPSALTATADGAGVLLKWVSPPDDKHDVVEVWEATTNDRTGAVLLSARKSSSVFVSKATSITRYYWIRARSQTRGRSEWHPLSSTGGVTATYGGAAGAAGSNVARARIYQRSPTSPTLPSASVTFTFATGGMTGLNNGWTATIPAGSDPLWISEATAMDPGATDTILAGEWATAVILVEDGINSATIYLYQRNTTGIAPSVPAATLTYTFSTGLLSGGSLAGWSQTVPAETDGKFCFVTTATALSAASTDSITTGEWAAVRLMTMDGVSGGPTINVDPNVTSARLWQTYSGSNWEIATITDGAVGNTELRSVASASNAWVIDAYRYPIDLNKTYQIRAYVRRKSGDRGVWLAVTFYDSSGSEIAGSPATGWTAGGGQHYWSFANASTTELPADSVWRQATFTFGLRGMGVIPSNAKTFTIGVILNYTALGTTDGVCAVQDLAVTELLEQRAWQPVYSAGIAMIGDVVRKSYGNSAWAQGAYSQQGYVSAGVTFRFSQTNKDLMVGLNSDPTTNHDYTSIDYAWNCNSVDGGAEIYESGSLILDTGSFAVTDQFEVQCDGAVVRYMKNGVVLRTVGRSGGPMHFDSSFYNNAAEINSLSFSGTSEPGLPMVWTPVLVGVIGNGQTYTKIGGDGWDASVYSLQGYERCQVSFVIVQTNKRYAVGLDSAPTTDNAQNSIDGAWLIDESTGKAYVIEGGSTNFDSGTYAAGDRFSIVRDATETTYYKNGAALYVVAAGSGLKYLDSSLYTSGAVINGLVFEPLEAVNTGGMTLEAATEVAEVTDTGPVTATANNNQDIQFTDAVSLEVDATDDVFEVTATGRSTVTVGGSAPEINAQIQYRLDGGSWNGVGLNIDRGTVSSTAPFALTGSKTGLTVGTTVEFAVMNAVVETGGSGNVVQTLDYITIVATKVKR